MEPTPRARGLRRPILPGAVLLAALAIVELRAQAPAVVQERDVRPVAATATIAGVVVSDDADARPVRKARVTCSGPAGGATTITDEAGRFIFPDLPPGRYTVAAFKATWVATAYGAKRANRPGTPVPV